MTATSKIHTALEDEYLRDQITEPLSCFEEVKVAPTAEQQTAQLAAQMGERKRIEQKYIKEP